METTKVVLIVLAIGMLVLAGFLGSNLLTVQSPDVQHQVPGNQYEAKSNTATAYLVTRILPNQEVQK